MYAFKQINDGIRNLTYGYTFDNNGLSLSSYISNSMFLFMNKTFLTHTLRLLHEIKLIEIYLSCMKKICKEKFG